MVDMHGDPFIDLGTPAYMNGVPITIYIVLGTLSPKLHRYGGPHPHPHICGRYIRGPLPKFLCFAIAMAMPNCMNQ